MVMKENIKNKMAAYYVKLENIVDNLTTNDSTKVLSAKQGKQLQDNKLDKTHTSHKGKNVVTNSTTGVIEFEDKYTHPSTKQCNAIIPTVVDTVADGNSNAVSSNAVYDYINTIIGDIEEDMLS